MSVVELIATIMQSLAFVVLYIFVGFGPGFVLGILLANGIFGRGKPMLYETHQEKLKNAAQHNAQWDPSHERWQK